MSVTVSTPSALGTTSLDLKESLSYRWVLNNAEIFLRNISQGQGLSLRSPTFSVLLPLKEDSKEVIKQISKWHLLVKPQRSTSQSPCKSISIFLSQESDIRYSISSKTGRHRNAKSSSLPLGKKQKALICDCTFSILDPRTSGTRDTATASPQRCVIGEALHDFGVKDFMKQDEIDNYLSNDTLTLQVDATLLCYADPIETLNEASKVPPDDIRKDLGVLLQDELFTDVVIECEGKKFKAHKLILASQSPVFRRMFEIEMRESLSSVLVISDISPAVVSDLLCYLYTGTPPHLNTLAKDLLNAADKYELPRLFALCENDLKMKITLHSVVELFILGDMHRAAHLKESCLKFIRCNITEVCKSDCWKALRGNSDTYCQILSSEILD